MGTEIGLDPAAAPASRDELAGLPAAPVAGAVSVPVIAAAVLAGMGIGWASLSPGEQVRVTGAVASFLTDGLDPGDAVALGWDAAASAFKGGGVALEERLDAGQRADLDDRVRQALGPPEPETEDRRMVDPEPNGPKTAEDDEGEGGLAFRAVIRNREDEAGADMGSAYYEPPRPGEDLPRNVAVNRLVQTPDAHDLTHALFGLGLNGIGAEKIPAPYPMTGIDVRDAGLPPSEDKQRNLNGLYIELLNDGFYEAMIEGDRIDLPGAARRLPPDLVQWGQDVLATTHEGTGYRATNADAFDGTDYGDHADIAWRAGIADLRPVPGQPDAVRPKLREEYIEMVKDEFGALLDGDKALKALLSKNLDILLQNVAARDRAVIERGHPPVGGAEVVIPPAQMEPILETAIKALEKVIADVAEKRPSHEATDLEELRDFYRSVLDGAVDETLDLARAEGPATG